LTALPKLRIDGLGLSTLAKNAGGKTAEELADMQILKDQKNAAKKKAPSNSDSDSDAGLPPPIPVNNPSKVLPKLNIGGLGLSTLAKGDGEKTAEEMADMQTLKQS